MANRQTRAQARLNRKFSKANPGNGLIPFGRCVNSSLERKANGKSPYGALTRK